MRLARQAFVVHHQSCPLQPQRLPGAEHRLPLLYLLAVPVSRRRDLA
ncbi:hypothetical protein ACWD1Z_34985 [Streptomyces sp. NPDC002784]